MKQHRAFLSSLLMVLSLGVVTTTQAETEINLMDLVDVQGIRQNQLVGYGLVVGLNGQGDRNQVKFTSQSITNMLRQFGVQIDDSMNPKLKKRRISECDGIGRPNGRPRSNHRCGYLVYRRC